MLYEVMSESYGNDDTMHVWLNSHKVGATNALDAICIATDYAEDGEDVFMCESGAYTYMAYRMEDGTFEIHIYDNDCNDTVIEVER